MTTNDVIFKLDDFAYPPRELAVMLSLLKRFPPCRIAEFGCGNSTRIWAMHSNVKITTWDNLPQWVDVVRKTFNGEPWLDRVEFRTYDVSPAGPRWVQKQPVSWEGDSFDFLFLDGPRAAHETSFGRSGTFEFAAKHASPGAVILWHDAENDHVLECAFRYFRHCRIHHAGRLSWCVWQHPSLGMLKNVLWNLRCRRYWRFLNGFAFGSVLSGRKV